MGIDPKLQDELDAREELEVLGEDWLDERVDLEELAENWSRVTRENLMLSSKPG